MKYSETISCFHPSEIAMLVLGYLMSDSKLIKSKETFIQESPYLNEFREMFKKDDDIYSIYFSQFYLEDMLEEYGKIINLTKNLVKEHPLLKCEQGGIIQQIKKIFSKIDTFVSHCDKELRTFYPSDAQASDLLGKAKDISSVYSMPEASEETDIDWELWPDDFENSYDSGSEGTCTNRKIDISERDQNIKSEEFQVLDVENNKNAINQQVLPDELVSKHAQDASQYRDILEKSVMVVRRKERTSSDEKHSYKIDFLSKDSTVLKDIIARKEVSECQERLKLPANRRLKRLRKPPVSSPSWIELIPVPDNSSDDELDDTSKRQGSNIDFIDNGVGYQVKLYYGNPPDINENYDHNVFYCGEVHPETLQRVPSVSDASELTYPRDMPDLEAVTASICDNSDIYGQDTTKQHVNGLSDILSISEGVTENTLSRVAQTGVRNVVMTQRRPSADIVTKRTYLWKGQPVVIECGRCVPLDLISVFKSKFGQRINCSRSVKLRKAETNDDVNVTGYSTVEGVRVRSPVLTGFMYKKRRNQKVTQEDVEKAVCRFSGGNSRSPSPISNKYLLRDDDSHVTISQEKQSSSKSFIFDMPIASDQTAYRTLKKTVRTALELFDTGSNRREADTPEQSGSLLHNARSGEHNAPKAEEDNPITDVKAVTKPKRKRRRKARTRFSKGKNTTSRSKGKAKSNNSPQKNISVITSIGKPESQKTFQSCLPPKKRKICNITQEDMIDYLGDLDVNMFLKSIHEKS